MASGSGRRRLRAGSNALQIAVRLVEVHGVAAADCGCQRISSLQRRRTELARWKSLGWEAGARFTVRSGHGPGTLRGSKGLSGVSLENEVGDEALSTTLKSDLAPASANCSPTASRHARRLQRLFHAYGVAGCGHGCLDRMLIMSTPPGVSRKLRPPATPLRRHGLRPDTSTNSQCSPA